MLRQKQQAAAVASKSSLTKTSLKMNHTIRGRTFLDLGHVMCTCPPAHLLKAHWDSITIVWVKIGKVNNTRSIHKGLWIRYHYPDMDHINTKCKWGQTSRKATLINRSKKLKAYQQARQFRLSEDGILQLWKIITIISSFQFEYHEVNSRNERSCYKVPGMSVCMCHFVHVNISKQLIKTDKHSDLCFTSWKPTACPTPMSQSLAEATSVTVHVLVYRHWLPKINSSPTGYTQLWRVKFKQYLSQKFPGSWSLYHHILIVATQCMQLKKIKFRQRD